MATRDFVAGFLQGFHETGGTERLSSYAGRNIADGKFYDPKSDPVFQQDMQRALETGLPAYREYAAEKYGDFIDTGDQSFADYHFTPAEGTQQWLNQRMAEEALTQTEQATQTGELKLEFLPDRLQDEADLRGLSLDMDRLNLNLLTDTYDDQVRISGAQADQAETQTLITDQQLEQIRTTNQYLDRQLENELTQQELNIVNTEIQNEIARQQRDLQRDLMPYEIALINQQVKSAILQNKSGQRQLDLFNATFDDQVATSGYQAEGARLGNVLTGLNIDQMRALRDNNWIQPGSMTGTAGGIGSSWQPDMDNIVTWIDNEPYFANDRDILVNAYGMPYVDEQGRQYYYFTDYRDNVSLEPFYPFDIGGETTQPQDEGGGLDWLYNLMPWNWGSDDGGTTQTQPTTPEQEMRNQPRGDVSTNVNNVVTSYKNYYPNLSDSELAQYLEQDIQNDPETSELFIEQYGVPVTTVINYLRHR